MMIMISVLPVGPVMPFYSNFKVQSSQTKATNKLSRGIYIYIYFHHSITFLDETETLQHNT